MSVPAIYATITTDDKVLNLDSDSDDSEAIVIGDFNDSEMDIGNVDDYRTGTTTCVAEICNSAILE